MTAPGVAGHFDRFMRGASQVLLAWLLAASSHAQAEGPWVLLYSSHEAQPPRRIEQQLDAVSGALRQRGATVMPDVAARFERVQSQPATDVVPERLGPLRAGLETATHHLALGELDEALHEMQMLERQPDAIRDALSHDFAQAKTMFSACVTTAYLLHGVGKTTEASARLQGCTSRFPGFELAPSEFDADMRRFFDRTAQQRALVWLSVDAPSSERPCTVRLFGVDVGRAPLRIRARPGVARVELDCGDSAPGRRVHQPELVAGENSLTIDPQLDRAVQVAGPWLALRYADRESLGMAPAHGLEIARALGAGALLQVVGGSPLQLRRIELEHGSVIAQSEWSGSADDLPESIGALLQGAAPKPAASTAASAPHASAVPRTQTQWFGLSPGSPALFAIAGGAWAASVAASAVLLSERSHLRVEGGALVQRATPEDEAQTLQRLRELNEDYNSKGRFSALIAGATNGMGVATALLALPHRDSTPWWAWSLGGAGTALVVTGAVMTAAISHCAITTPLGKCKDWERDSMLGPLLMIHAAAPLSVGATYLFTKLLGTDVSVAVQAEPRRTSLRVRGSF